MTWQPTLIPITSDMEVFLRPTRGPARVRFDPATGQLSRAQTQTLAEVFVRLPLEGMRGTECEVLHSQPSACIDLPVVHRDGVLVTSYDWGCGAILRDGGKTWLNALQAVGNNSDLLGRLGRGLGVVHPYSHEHPWAALVGNANLKDGTLVSLGKKFGLTGRQGDELGLLNQALVGMRPLFSDWLWEIGARRIDPNGLFAACSPNLDDMGDRLGRWVDHGNGGDRIETKVKSGKGHWTAGATPEALATRFGEVWRERVREALPGKAPTCIGIETLPGGRRIDHPHTLISWLVRSGQDGEYSKVARQLDGRAAESLKRAWAADRIAWLNTAVAMGCKVEDEVPAPGVAEGTCSPSEVETLTFAGRAMAAAINSMRLSAAEGRTLGRPRA